MASVTSKATPGTLEWIPVKDLNFGPENPYQRPVKPHWLEFLVNNWNPDIVGVLEVSKREDGTLWVKEGQHRCLAKVRRGEQDDAMACHVMIHQSLSTEARNARDMNQLKAGWSAYDGYNAMLAEGHEEAIGIQGILDPLGIKVIAGASSDQVEKGGLLFAIGTVINLYRRTGGPELTEKVFAVLSSAWPDTQHTYNSTIIKGMALFLAYHELNEDTDDIARALRRSSNPNELLDQARAMKKRGRWALASYMAMAIEQGYNFKRGERSRLRDTAAVTYATALKRYEHDFEPATEITAEAETIVEEVAPVVRHRRRKARR